MCILAHVLTSPDNDINNFDLLFKSKTVYFSKNNWKYIINKPNSKIIGRILIGTTNIKSYK